MAAPLSPPLTEETLQGCKDFRLLGPLFTRLHTVGTERDRAGNRPLLYDQYATLRLLDFFNPTVTSLRGVQQSPTLTKVQERLGIRRTSLGALREAASGCDAALWHEIVPPLGAPRRPPVPLAEQEALAQVTAGDGRLGPAVPRMAWALGHDDQPRAAKRPGAGAVLRQGPVEVTVTAGNGSERAEWRGLGQPGGFDAGVFQDLHDVPGSFLCRVQEARPLAPTAVHAGVGHDAVLRRLGTAHHTRLLPQPCRVVPVATGTTRQDGTPDVLVLGTHRLDLDAALLAVAYR